MKNAVQVFAILSLKTSNQTLIASSTDKGFPPSEIIFVNGVHTLSLYADLQHCKLLLLPIYKVI